MTQELPSTKILGVEITKAPKKEILDYIITGLKEGRRKFYIVTPNPEIIMLAQRSRSFMDILNGATVSLPDGIGVLAAGNILKKGIKERITGVDFMLDLCKECARVGLSIGLLGGREGVAEKTAECLRKKYPGLVVKLATSDQASTSSHIDILFVAFGAPKQEEWIVEYLDKLDVTAMMGVGGAFDYISGKVKRAPKMVRMIGMEWAYRLVRQPWRLRRQLVLPVFAGKILKEKIIGK